MKNNKINDERVINEKRKITGEAYGLIMIFLIISILVKQFIFHSEFNEYAVEFIAFFGSSTYIIIRNIFVGNNLYGDNKKSLPIINSIIMGASVTFTLVFLRFNEFNTLNDFILESLMAFICSVLSSFLFFYIINKINIKRIKYIENKYNDEDE
jgi:exosortase/archaeosortase